MYLSQSLLFISHKKFSLLQLLLLSLILLVVSSLIPPYTSPNSFSMLPMKSEGSSCPKGKENVVDEPPAEGEKGEKAPHSESNHSEEEEATCDPIASTLSL